MAERLWLTLPDGLREQLLAHLESGEENLNAFCLRAIETAFTGAPGTPAEPAPRGPVTLDDAARTLLGHVPPPMAELITDLCAEHHRQPAEYLLSYAHLAYERGETALLLG